MNYYIYANGALPGAQPIYSNVPGQMVANSYTLDLPAGGANLAAQQTYSLSLGPMTARNPGSAAVCQRNVPPAGNCTFVV